MIVKFHGVKILHVVGILARTSWWHFGEVQGEALDLIGDRLRRVQRAQIDAICDLDECILPCRDP